MVQGKGSLTEGLKFLKQTKATQDVNPNKGRIWSVFRLLLWMALVSVF